MDRSRSNGRPGKINSERGRPIEWTRHESVRCSSPDSAYGLLIGGKKEKGGRKETPFRVDDAVGYLCALRLYGV